MIRGWLLFSLALRLLASSQADQKSFDCKMRQLGLDYASKIQTTLTSKQSQEIADALNGAREAQNCNVSVLGIASNYDKRASAFPMPHEGASTFYTDAIKGNDSNAGTMDSPFQTIAKAVMAARAAGQYSTIVLRKGTFYLTETIELGSKDKGLTIQNYQMEEVWISGGMVITPKWDKYDVNN